MIASEDPQRGGKMVAFLHYMAEDTSITANSISNYVWGIRAWMKAQRQSDPLMGVENWHDIMLSIRVLTHVPSEPRRAIPKALLRRMLETVNVNVFWEVQWALFVLILFFTFSRTECPCPKNFTGEESWDDDQHWMVRDIVIRQVGSLMQWALAVRFKAIKQDPRLERGEARGDGTDRNAHLEGGADWAYVGDAPGSIFSVFHWYRLLMQFYFGPRRATDPFFMARDRVRPYTYSAAYTDLKTMLLRVGDDDEYGLHGLRVEGYNQFRTELGEELAQVQGLWKPGSDSRYARFDVGEVMSGPAHVAGVANPYNADRRRPAPRDLQRVRPVRHGEQRARDDAMVGANAPPVHDRVDAHGAAGAIFVASPPLVAAPAVRPAGGMPAAMVAGALFGAPPPRPAGAMPPVQAATPNLHAPHHGPDFRLVPPPPPQQQRRVASPDVPPLERRVTRTMGART